MTESVFIRWFAMPAIGLLLAACAGAPRVPEDSFYRLDSAAPAERLAAPVLDGVLVVQGGTSAPLYRDRALLYGEAAAPGRLQRYHYHYWTDTPPRLVQRGLADYLRAAGLARGVVAPEEGSAARYRLRVDIERLEHVRGPRNGKVVVMLRFVLSDRDNGAVLAQDSASADAAVATGEFTAVATAAERALADIYAQILLRLRGLP